MSCGDSLAAKSYTPPKTKPSNKASTPKRSKPVPKFRKELTEDDEGFWEDDEFEGHDYANISKINFSFHIPKNSFKLGELIQIDQEVLDKGEE